MSRFQKLFGVGPFGFGISLSIFILLWLLDRSLDHVAIAKQAWLSRLAGLILIGIWVCWHVWCLKSIRAWWNADRLCTCGPYRLVRHPIYCGGIFGSGLGVALIFNSWVLLSWPVIVYPIWSLLVRREEKMMEAEFGEEYRRYSNLTGRLFPRIFKRRVH
ncbi:MAG: isoprenylcysteine carboxylmethyltransferase family protein [Acidobacteriota bacterium]